MKNLARYQMELISNTRYANNIVYRISLKFAFMK